VDERAVVFDFGGKVERESSQHYAQPFCGGAMTHERPTYQVSQRPSRAKRILTATSVIMFGAGVFALPFWYVQKKKEQNVNLYNKAGPLSPGEKMRGAYMNVGSRDIGPDPEWQKRMEELKRQQAAK
jgi:hypothetical protein